MVAHVSDTMKRIHQKNSKKELPEFNVGDTIKMKIKVAEADKVRLHPFEGTVIQKNNRGVNSTFTVRKVSFGEGVERIFPLHSPVIESLQVVSRGKVKRAKLYYLRTMVGKRGRVKKEQSAQTETSTPTEAATAITTT